ncbi:hypothetical protein SAMN04488029_3246 [Reichenbachiella faecimaris]|uniref:Uncharacterized protein n=1 Tax=Reichenbachiella faecimaris TaxID=692418 RepID=A0A1W2GKE1_REIFA|nr:hypothetical protein [Reichenbachiella faecimaris]SMD37117.1 hypothetical protein SAMN04488029_3246 [Reichenbachiella faecimaris]
MLIFTFSVLFLNCDPKSSGEKSTQIGKEEQPAELPSELIETDTKKIEKREQVEVENVLTDTTFNRLYSLLIELNQTNNDKLLNSINVEFDKYLNLERKQMDTFRFDERFWNFAGYPFFNSLKKANTENLNFNIFEFVLKISPYYDATGEVEQGLTGLWAEIAYLKTEDFLKYIEPMDSTTRMKVLLEPWWWEIPKDSLMIKLEDDQLKQDFQYVFTVSG